MDAERIIAERSRPEYYLVKIVTVWGWMVFVLVAAIFGFVFGFLTGAR